MANRNIALVATSILVAFAIFYAVSYSNFEAKTIPRPRVAIRGAVAKNADFALRLLAELQDEAPEKNVFISPLSMETVLAMSYNGAEGLTGDAIAETLGLGSMSVDDVNEGYSDMVKGLADVDEAVVVKVANSIWVKQEVGSFIKSSFADSMERYYSGEVYVRRFDDQTATEINDWVSNRTLGKITKIVDKMENTLAVILCNTIYFSGNWTFPFDSQATEQEKFTLEDGSTVNVPMMFADDPYYSFEDPTSGAEAVRIPYGSGKIAMYVLLPPKGERLDTYIASLDSVNVEEIASGMTKGMRIVRFPRMSLEYAPDDLRPALTNMGMGTAFGDEANFGKMIDIPVSIGKVVHKTIVEINEKGTTAAGASAAFYYYSGNSKPPFVVDRPFLFLIRDDSTGSILFIGAIHDPTKTNSP